MLRVRLHGQRHRFLPGAYVCTPKAEFDYNRTRASGYLSGYNPAVSELGASDASRDDIRFLFSFRGAPSHRLRADLVSRDYGSAGVSLRLVDRWFNHTDDEKLSFAREILQSKFALAPRGIGSASIRLFEIMQLGRAPVIISDDWVEPFGPAWNEFSIRVSEDKLADLPRILAEREDDWKEMGDQARYAYERYYSPDAAIIRLVEYIEDLMIARPASHDETVYHRQWQCPFRMAPELDHASTGILQAFQEIHAILTTRGGPRYSVAGLAQG